MSEYKRLTERIDGVAHGYCGRTVDIALSGKYGLKRGCFECSGIIDRLAELEDKIESGLGFIVPCNVGDTVWYLNTTPSMTLARNTIYEGKLVRYHILNYPQPLGTCVLADIQIHNEYGTTEVPDVKGFGKIWFIDKSQAEARLKELKGEK